MPVGTIWPVLGHVMLTIPMDVRGVRRRRVRAVRSS
jgi:hypothetical protein